tara:strand:- start:8500 stop:9546 length:1047 start_codon:yes stop_codon:yes gene_type:complete
MITKFTKYCLLLVFVASISNDLVVAQNGGFAAAATRIGYGPRALSMGNAFTATTSEGIYPYYNPALAAEKTGFNQFDLSVSSLEFDRVYQTIGTNFKLPPSAGLSFGLIRTGVKDIDERSLSGYPLGNFNIAEYQFFTTFGIKFSSKFNAGITFKLNYANYHDELPAASSVGVDLGILYKITNHLNFGFTIQDMFANYTWNSSDLYGTIQARNVVNTFPTRFKWGLSYQRESFTIASEFEIQSYLSEVTSREIFIEGTSTPSIIESIDDISTNSGILRIGGSWKLHERFTLRGGYRITDTTTLNSGSVSSGFSIHLPFDTFAPSIDYAFVIEPYNVANMHVFALRLNL